MKACLREIAKMLSNRKRKIILIFHETKQSIQGEYRYGVLILRIKLKKKIFWPHISINTKFLSDFFF